jgi:hypothetical protein
MHKILYDIEIEVKWRYLGMRSGMGVISFCK